MSLFIRLLTPVVSLQTSRNWRQRLRMRALLAVAMLRIPFESRQRP
jgi:hypothetical protein